MDLARVLIIHGELAPRLTLRTLLEAGGYAVDVAATPAEALAKLDKGQYELVLSDSRVGSRRFGQDVLAYARVKDYKPATARITSNEPPWKRLSGHGKHVAVRTEDVPLLLGKVADLIGMRASRRYRLLRPAV
ncbi:MAG: hypothetical protein ABSC23_12370 [Bryobacteraceae bacterium]